MSEIKVGDLVEVMVVDNIHDKDSPIIIDHHGRKYNIIIDKVKARVDWVSSSSNNIYIIIPRTRYNIIGEGGRWYVWKNFFRKQKLL